MLYILIISIFINILLSLIIYMLTRHFAGLKARNEVLVGNIEELTKYYETYTDNILSHIEEEKERQEVTDDEAKQHILAIINNNNVDSNKLHKSKNN